MEDSAAGAIEEQQSLQALVEWIIWNNRKQELVTLVQDTIPTALQRNLVPKIYSCF